MRYTFANWGLWEPGHPGGFSRGARQPGSGFTLAELLVVISIIVILVAILMPFLGGVNERAYSSLCQNNLHKIGQALATSSSNSGGKLPTGDSWLLAARAYGSSEILVCPKGTYRGGGSDVTLTGDIEVIDAPERALFDDLEHNTTVWAFQERAAYVLPSPVTVDISAPGQYGPGASNYTSTSKTIPAGTLVDCYFTHFDPVGNTSTTTDGQVMKFSDDVLGVICTTSKLNESDWLGAPGTIYDTGQGSRGYESNRELVEFSADSKSYKILHYHSTFPGEETRILTKPGGEASYGINALVNDSKARPNQIYVVEYQRTSVNIDSTGWEAYAAPRHFGKSNALLYSGAVKLLTPEEFDPVTGPWRAE